jgi:hypothetical protein
MKYFLSKPETKTGRRSLLPERCGTGSERKNKTDAETRRDKENLFPDEAWREAKQCPCFGL